VVTETVAGPSSLVTSLLACLWFAWIVRLLQIATSRLGPRGGSDTQLSDSDAQFLRSLHIRV
jgi:hypothetical protein